MNSEAHNVVAETRAALNEIERQGTKQVTVDRVRTLVDLIDGALRGNADASGAQSLELYKAHLQAWVLHPGRVDAFTLEGWRQVSALGHVALKSALLINGGASIALLAFLGHLSTFDALRPYLGPFAISLTAFASGVIASALASGAAFLTSRLSLVKSKGVTFFDVATIVLVILSYAAFLVGCGKAYSGFTTLHLPG